MLKSPIRLGPDDANATVVSATTTAAEVAIPTLQDGSRARYVAISSAVAVAVLPGTSGVSAATSWNTSLSIEAGDLVVLNVAGATHLGYDSRTTTGDLWIVPLENQ